MVATSNHCGSVFQAHRLCQGQGDLYNYGILYLNFKKLWLWGGGGG